MSRSTITGTPGGIPYDEYLRKIQSTDIDEDPDQYEKYLRRELADFRNDAPFWESDQIRDPNDRGSGFGSRERLALRYYGARSEIEPYLPDGTFLDHEFMERDPRGTQNLPDFAAARKQREARGQFVKFYNDDDHSVPETAINPKEMNKLIRGAQQQFKDRFKNFDESMDAWHNGSSVHMGKRRSGVVMTTTDGTILDLTEASAQQRQDPVNLLSNRTPAMLRLTAPDHRVKISKYGMIKPMQSMEYNKWQQNRLNSHLDHARPVEINGQMVNRMLAMMIVDLEGQRATKQSTAQGTMFLDSEVDQTRASKQRINPEDLYKMLLIGMTSGSHAASANQEFFDNAYLHRSASVENADPVASRGLVKLNHHIIESMVSSNRTLGVQEAKDIRNAIKQSAADNGIYLTNSNRMHGVSKTGPALSREAMTSHAKLESNLEVKNYGGLKPSKKYNPHEMLAYEDFAKNSKLMQNRHTGITVAKNLATDSADNELDMQEFALPGRKKKLNAKDHMGRRKVHDYGDIDRSDSETGDQLRQSLYDMVLS